jgi:hypothetical protein
MSDFSAIEGGNDGLGIWFFIVPLLSIATVWIVLRVLNELALWVVSTCEPVQVPTDQTNNPKGDPTTSHTGMPEGPVPATSPEPSLTRAGTRTRDDPKEIYERVQVRDPGGRFTSKRVLVRIDL